MRLSVKACAVASGVLWGGGVLMCGIINLAVPTYGRGFLKMLRSLYPGFHFSRTVPDVLVGTGYALLDGATTGALFAVLYNSVGEGRASSREVDPAGLQTSLR